MDFYDQIKLPAIILGSPRSGTTVLSFDIADYYRSKGVTMDGIDVLPQDEIITAIDNNKKCVLKIHPSNLQGNDQLIDRLYSKKCYLIRLSRNDIISQITSNYVELIRKRYCYVYDYEEYHEPIRIDHDQIQQAVSIILTENLKLSLLPFTFDIELVYEDLVFHYTELIKTPRPANYDEIKQLITNYYMQVKNED